MSQDASYPNIAKLTFKSIHCSDKNTSQQGAF